MELFLTSDADTQLQKLEKTSTLTQLLQRVNQTLDELETDNPAPHLKRRRYQTPPVWGVTVHGSGEDWLILWGDDQTGKRTVFYIGPEI